jgi:hypothetical protein
MNFSRASPKDTLTELTEHNFVSSVGSIPAGIGDQRLAALGAADKPCLGLGLTHVPTADETEHPSADAYIQCCAKYPQFYRRASPAALA